MTVRRSINGPIIIHKKVADIQDGSYFIIEITPEDTSKLNFGNYVYDIQATFSGCVKTLVGPSSFCIGEEVTYGN